MADEARTRAELIAELRELRNRIRHWEGQQPPEEPTRSVPALKQPERTSRRTMASVTSSGERSPSDIVGQFSQTIDLSNLVDEDFSDSGSFLIGSEIWATTFGKIMQSLPIPAFLVDESSRISTLNHACSRISSDYMKFDGSSFADLFHSSLLKERAHSLIELIFSDRKSRSWEASFECARKRIWGRFSFRPVRIMAQRFLMVIIEDLTQKNTQLEQNTMLKNELEVKVHRRTAQLAEANELLTKEISRREEVEAALRKSEERFRELAELLPELVFEVDHRGFLTFSNRSGSDALGYPREELEGKHHMLQLLSSEDHARARKQFKRIRRGQKLSAAPYSVIRKDGSTLEVSAFIAPIFRDGKVLGARGVAVDISELKQTQSELAQLNADLEQRIQERTAELVLVNEKLKEEIEQREAIRRELEAEKERLASILESMEDGVHMVDQEGTIQFINRALLQDLGPVAGRRCYQYFHDRSEPCEECHMGRVTSGKPTRFEWFCSKNGKTYELMDSAVQNADGSIWKLEIFRNITKRKRAEEALRENEKRYRELIENATDIVFETDARGIVTFANAAGERVTGLSQEEFVGKHYLDFVPEQYKKRVQRFYGIQFVKKQPDSYYEYPMIAKDGRELWLGQQVHLVIHDREVVGFQSICRDITERHQIEVKLRKSEEHFRELSDFLPQFVFEVDQDLKFIFVNRAGILQSGYTEEEFCGGLSLLELLARDNRTRLLTSTRQIKAETWNLIEEFTMIRKDASTLPVIMFASPIMRDGSFQGIRGVAVDITRPPPPRQVLRSGPQRERREVPPPG